jgi:phage terminase large subunit
MQDHTADSVKSLEGFDRAWVEESQSLSDRSLSLLRPTIRAEKSELWFSWNPSRPTDPIDQLLRGPTLPSGAAVVRANWSDNPWFPDVLEGERRDCLANQSERYGHIWEGEYATVLEGAYYAKHLTEAQLERRIGFVARDPLMKVYAFWDIGGTSSRSDATSIWVAQFVGSEVRVLNYYEAVGQPFEAHVNWLRSEGYEESVCVLPHDGRKHDQVYAVTPMSYLQEAGFAVDLVRNQGAGAALQRVDATRRLFPSIRFNEETTKGGRDALGWYHEKRDEARGIGLGPEHDFASHACLVAGTIVETARGSVPIECIKPGDMVVTPAGFAHVQWAGQTKISKEIIRATLSNGVVLEMTPEHKLFTTKGVVCADTLRYGEEVITEKDMQCRGLANASKMGYRAAFIESFGATGTGGGKSANSTSAKKVAGNECFTGKRLVTRPETKSLLKMAIGTILPQKTGSRRGKGAKKNHTTSILSRLSTASGTICAQMTATMLDANRAAYSCTGLSGATTTEKSLPGTTFTTSTATRPTTASKTFNFFRQQITPGFTLGQAVGSEARRTSNNFEAPGKSPKNGTPAQKVLRGIAKMASGPGKAASLFQLFAQFAGLTTIRFTQQNQSSAVEIVKLRRIARSVPVYDLTVDLHHCYYANGVLVSNSDAFGMIAIYKATTMESQGAWDKPLRRGLKGIL